MEIGYKGGIDGAAPIVLRAIGIDYPGYDGTKRLSQMKGRSND
jgi:hypothetical protein